MLTPGVGRAPATPDVVQGAPLGILINIKKTGSLTGAVFYVPLKVT